MWEWLISAGIWNKDRRRSSFELRVRLFVLLAAMPLLVVLLVTGVTLLREMDAISTRTGTARSAYLPAILEGHRIAVNIEALRRYAAIVYMADDADARRDARLTALALGTETAFTRDRHVREMVGEIYKQILRIEELRAVVDTAIRATEDELTRLESVMRQMLAGTTLTAAQRNELATLHLVALMRTLRDARSPEELHRAQQRVNAVSDRLTAAAMGRHAALEQAGKFRRTAQQVIAARNRTLLEDQHARLTLEDVDRQLHQLRDKLNVASVDLTYNTLLSIDDHASWMKRTVYLSCAFTLVVFALLFVLLQMYIVRPIIMTSNKLQDIRTGKDSPPLSSIRIAELNEVATLINISSEQLAVLYQHTRELEREKEQIRNIAITDALTGIYNRRYFDMQYKLLLDEALFKREPLSVAIMDIDLFKVYNDTLGHSAGDECLARVAEAIQASLHRKTDMVFRYGGEEFVVILPGCTADVALVLAERIRAHVHGLGIVHPDSPVSSVVTISVGVATLSPLAPVTGKTLLDLADEAMYQAKKTGRNRVCAAPAPVV